MDNDTTETDDTPRPGTTHPHLARERALKVLFAADVRKVDPRVLLDEVSTRPADLELLDELEPDQEQVAGDEELQLELTRRRRLPLDDYTRTLVRGVAAHRPSIDRLLDDVADRWPVHRMPAVDRNLLRMAVYELAEQDTPHPVVIDEAVALAIAFAGEKARSFVNGVLETIRQRIVAGEVELEVAPEPQEPAEDTVEDSAAAADRSGEGQADSSTEGVEEDLTTEALDDVDEAASAAYDLALDLLDAEGPLEESPLEDDEDPADPAGLRWTDADPTDEPADDVDLDWTDAELTDELADQAELDWTDAESDDDEESADEGDEGWETDLDEPPVRSLDDLDLLDDLDGLTTADEPDTGESPEQEAAEEPAASGDVANGSGPTSDHPDRVDDDTTDGTEEDGGASGDVDLSDLRDEDEALW